QEARAIDEVHNRQMEGLREVDEALHLLAGVRGPRPAVEVRIAGQDRHRPAVEPGQPGDDRAAVERLDLEERLAVHYRLHDRAHLVPLSGVAGRRVASRLPTGAGWVGSA